MVLSAYCMNQRESIGIRNLPEEVQRTEAKVVEMNVDIGYHLEVRTSVLCVVSIARPSIPEVISPCL